MYTPTDRVELPSGEAVEFGVALCPDPNDSLGIGELLVHKPGDWKWHLQLSIASGTDDCETRFYVAVIDGIVVANVLISENGGVGILGHVFTHPEHRRKGLCQAIFDRMMPDFRERGGTRLVLGTGFELPAYWIYHRNGFRSRLPGSGMMTYETAGNFVETHYAKAPVRVEPIAWRHWPQITQLLADDFGQGLQNLAFGYFGPASFEGRGVSLMKSLAEGHDIQARVLEAEFGAVVGFATLQGDCRWPRVRLFDVVVHPSFDDEFEAFVASFAWPEDKVQSHVPSAATARRAALEANGFEVEAVLREQLPNGDDAVVYTREF